LEQQALERWRMQQEARIEDMMRRGAPLGAVAAALASPETAERIAVLEAATTGQMSALDAARLNVQRAGHDLSLLDGLRSVGGDFLSGVLNGQRSQGSQGSQGDQTDDGKGVAANGASPLSVLGRQR
jgi:hypothetical protein